MLKQEVPVTRTPGRRFTSHLASNAESLPMATQPLRSPRLRAPLAALAMLSCWVGFDATCLGQVVQLPSVRNFSYSGSFWVPDSGTLAVAGSGAGFATSSSRGWGPYGGSRGLQSAAGGTAITTSVHIIDLQALDEAILSGGRSAATSAKQPSVSPQPQRNYLSSSTAGPSSTRELASRSNSGQWQRALAGGGLQAPKPPSVAEAEQANHIVAARVYYRMAVEAMTPELIQRYQQILAEREAEEAQQRAAADQANRQSF